ncbi:MAG: transposase [Deinococcales bacterium]
MLRTAIRAYKSQGVSVGYHEQAVSLPEAKEALPELKQIHSQVLQDTLKRLDKAYQAFFARLKRGDKAGFPRFQGRNRFDSITYPQYQGKPTARSVYLPKIGNVRIKLHRELEGKVKTCTVKRDRCGDWYVVFSCEITAQAVTQPDTSGY